MNARLRRITVGLVAAALSATLGAGWAVTTGHSTTHHRVVADGLWCC